jgi:ADP-heptose:LPS heptosyltransferase
MWPVEKFIALLDAFLARHEDFVVFVLGGTDLHLDRGRCGDRVIPCCHLPIGVSLALVGLCDVFIGVDSCMLHAADLCRVPGVGLFGPTDPVEFGYRFGRGIHVRGGPFMEDIEEDAVLEALESVLP